MQNITSTAGLKDAIQLLEVEQTSNGQLLKEQFHITYESFKPVNLLKNTLEDIGSSPSLVDNITGNALGLASGYLIKKIVVGSSGNMFRKLLGIVLQVGVSNVVTQHPDVMKLFGRFLFQRILHKKEMNSKSRDR
jgi:hypothetical protein